MGHVHQFEPRNLAMPWLFTKAGGDVVSRLLLGQKQLRAAANNAQSWKIPRA